MTTTGSKFSLFRRDRPPPVPEKDVFLSPAAAGPYASSSYSRSAASVASSSVLRSTSPRSGTLDSGNGTRIASSASPVSASKQNGASPHRGMSTLRKAIAKIPRIPSLPKRPSHVSLAPTPSMQSLHETIEDHGDDNISLPWNINHELHVEPIEDGLAGLPPSWSGALSRVGFSEHEIHSMYSRQRRFPPNASSNTPPLTPNTVPPSSPIVSTAVRFAGRAAPTLPRSISPISSAGQRPYSPNSSAQSTFTSDFPSEFGSIRIRKASNRGETPPPLPVNSMSIPRKAPPLVVDVSPVETQRASPISRRVEQKPPEVNAGVASEPPHPVEVSATVNVRPPSDQSSTISGGSSEHDALSQPGSEPSSAGLVPPPPLRAPMVPPRLSLSTAPNEDGEWSSTLLSSFGRDFGLADFLSSPTGPTPSTLEDRSGPNADSPARQTPLAARSSPLGPGRAPSISTPHLAASSSSEYVETDRDDNRRDTIRPNALLTPTPTPGSKCFSPSSRLPQDFTRSNSIRSVLTASSRDANSSRGSLDDVEGASITKSHVKSISISGKARAITVRAKRRSATMQPSANGAPPVLVPPVPPPDRITINGANLPAAASLAAGMTDSASAKRRPPPIREATASPSLSADEPPTPGLTNNSRKSTEHTDGSSSIRSPMASPMVPGFSSNGLPVRELCEDGEDDNDMLDDITSAYAAETFVDDDRSARRLTQVPRETEVAYLQNASVRITDPPTPHSAVNVPRPRAPSPISPSPATPSSFKTTRGMYTGAGSVSDEPGRKRPPSLLGTQTLPHSPARSAPRSPMTGGAPTPRASSSPQGAAVQGKFSPATRTGATLSVPGLGLQTSVIAHPKRSPVSPPDKELPPPPIEDEPSLILSSNTNARHQQSATIDTLDMVKSRKLFAPLNPYLSATDPRVRFSDLAQVAEGQWGPVYAARAREAGTAISVRSFSSESSTASRYGTLVAVKTIKVEEEGSSKVDALASELAIMADVRHEHVLFTAGLFVNEDTLWIEMELMERSLADMLPLVEQGLVVSEPEVARFASDALSGLAYLETLHIAHRDIRSDNLLLSRNGVLKLADFSQAVVTQPNVLLFSVVPVPPYWMAPEMRMGRPYDAHLIDIWSVGATIWEVIEGSPPFLNIEDPHEFSDRWPPLRRTSEFSPSLHHFLRLCSDPDDWRPRATELLESPFLSAASPRNDIITLLAEVRLLEDGLYEQ